jgi:hypothetical protein
MDVMDRRTTARRRAAMALIQTIKATKMLLPLPPYVIGRTAIS